MDEQPTSAPVPDVHPGAESGPAASAPQLPDPHRPIIEVEEIGKSYGSIIALTDITTSVRAGEVTCVLGDNGAGKSTFIKILLGLIAPTSGQVLVGCEGNEKALAYAIERVGPAPFMFASDFPHEISLGNCMEEINEIVERTDLKHEHKAAILGDNAREFYKI